MTQKAVKKSKGAKPYKMIAVSPKVYDKLQEQGRMGDSMDGIIARLLVLASQSRRYQCVNCGNFISTVVNPQGFECPGCRKATPLQWRQGEF